MSMGGQMGGGPGPMASRMGMGGPPQPGMVRSPHPGPMHPGGQPMPPHQYTPGKRCWDEECVYNICYLYRLVDGYHSQSLVMGLLIQASFIYHETKVVLFRELNILLGICDADKFLCSGQCQHV